MKFHIKHHVSRETYCELYRYYYRQRYHSSTLLIVCALLYFIELLIQLYTNSDINITMNFTLVMIIVGTIMQFVNEFVFPNTEYRTLEEKGLTNTTATITDEYIMYGSGMDSESSNWDEYIKCIETSQAFLLLKKRSFSLLIKDDSLNELDEIRTMLSEKVNKGKPIKRKK